MSEQKRTLTFVGGAAVLALLAFLSAPRATLPDAFADRGEAFFPGFDDPDSVATLEVVEFNESTGSAKAFKVTHEDGKWTIPSHHDYPADGKDRLAKTAAGVIGIVKDDFRSNNLADHEALGVLDPLEEGATSLEGRGKRVTLKGASGTVLADFIIGKQPEGRTDYRFLRLPEKKRVYTARMNIELSTRFEDWIEKDLLQVARGDIERVIIKDYSINERTGFLNQRDVVTLTREDGQWKTDRMPANREVDSTKTDALLGALDDLKLAGVRPKPAGLSASLSRTSGAGLTQADVVSLQGKGYYFTRDGQLVSNEGETQVRANNGVLYTLRFGEVVYGSGEAITAGSEPGGQQAADRGPAENRYLFITTEFDPAVLPEPAQPKDAGFKDKPEDQWSPEDRNNKELFDAHEAWQKKIDDGRTQSEELNARFASWYYVIPADSFEKMRVSRRDLLKAKS